VELEVYNILGQRVVSLVNEDQDAGSHVVIWYGHNAKGARVASGVYFYRLTAGSFTDVKKLVLLK
ncbi:MAG: T9SS type A sorting domain-containing protein, partial [Bacteroidota bacterium]